MTGVDTSESELFSLLPITLMLSSGVVEFHDPQRTPRLLTSFGRKNGNDESSLSMELSLRRWAKERDRNNFPIRGDVVRTPWSGRIHQRRLVMASSGPRGPDYARREVVTNPLLSLLLLKISVTSGVDYDAKTANDKPLIKTTHVYKTVGDVKVEADVSRPTGTEARPVAVSKLGTGSVPRQRRAARSVARAFSGHFQALACCSRVACSILCFSRSESRSDLFWCSAASTC